jgi:phage gp16-like protein
MRANNNNKLQNYPDLITKGQIQLIKIAQKELGIEDDDYRDMLMKNFRASSCTQLTKAQATKLIERFGELGFETRGGSSSSAKRGSKRREWAVVPRRSVGREQGKIVQLASIEELRKIEALAALIDWDYKDGLARWMEKRMGVSRVKTAREAWLVIEGLKKMFANKMKQKFGKDWWDMEFDDPGTMRFIEEHRPKG